MTLYKARVLPTIVGVPHNGELPYVIGFSLVGLDRDIRLDTQMVDVIRWDEEDEEWAKYMIKLWTNFAKYG